MNPGICAAVRITKFSCGCMEWAVMGIIFRKSFSVTGKSGHLLKNGNCVTVWMN